MITEEKLPMNIEENERDFGNIATTSGTELLKNYKMFPKLSTGDLILDNFFNGGLDRSQLIEIAGEAGAGKTQICIQLMLEALIQRGNQNQIQFTGKSYYVSTQKPLNETRLNRLKETFIKKYRIKSQQQAEQIFENLLIRHFTLVEDLKHLIKTDLKNRLEDGENIQLVIIDSVAGICSDFIKESATGQDILDTFDRSKFLRELTQDLKTLAFKHNFCLIATNNMVSSPQNDETGYFTEDKQIPALGFLWKNLINTRIILRKLKANEVSIGSRRELKIDFCPRLPTQKIEFYINDDGVCIK